MVVHRRLCTGVMYDYSNEELLRLEYFCLNKYTIKDGVVRFNGTRITNAEVDTFRSLSMAWGADAKHVFYCTNIERGAKPETFRVLNKLFGRDQVIYYCGGRLKDADLKTFRVLDKGWYRTKYGPVFEG